MPIFEEATIQVAFASTEMADGIRVLSGDSITFIPALYADLNGLTFTEAKYVNGVLGAYTAVDPKNLVFDYLNGTVAYNGWADAIKAGKAGTWLLTLLRAVPQDGGYEGGASGTFAGTAGARTKLKAKYTPVATGEWPGIPQGPPITP